MSDSNGGKSILKNSSSFGRNTASVAELEREIQQESSSDDGDEEERGFGVKFRSERSIASVKHMTDRSGRVYDDWADVGYFLRYWGIGFSSSKTLTNLRDRLKDLKSNPLNRPGVVVRYLVQEKFNVNKAEKAFRDMVQWRERCHALQKDYEPPAELLEKYPGAILKDTDNDDDPIFLSRLGVTDLTGLANKYGSDEMLNYEIFRRESILNGTWQKEWSLKAGRPFKNILVIEDLDNLSSKQGISKVIAAIFGAAVLDQTYYPCVAKQIIVIRAPAHFRAAWTLAKRSIPKALRETIQVYGTSDYLKQLSAHVDLDSMPPCINPKGKGELLEGMSLSLEGGGKVYM
mmetsp:Transcript_29288/g.48405  ORF Transcript_29288/g.48405 Transcript_29288/m.48405 type:complete len:346 (+) Transcript_29288:89-1126(+)